MAVTFGTFYGEKIFWIVNPIFWGVTFELRNCTGVLSHQFLSRKPDPSIVGANSQGFTRFETVMSSH